MKKHRFQNNHSFTLIELLVVLALVAVLSVVVVITLNPAELLKQARDSNRLSDLSTINTALNLFSADVTSGFMGTSTIVYVSIPDTSPTCANLSLPALPTSTIAWTYNCVTAANLRNTNGTGWVPVNFQRISSNSPISQLPIDPQNTTTTGNYYTYVTGGSWMLTAIPESQKQKAELSTNPQITNYPGAIGMGNNLSLSPLFSSTGLVGYWKFDEGVGSIAKDSSGQGNNGSSAQAVSWIPGKINGGVLLSNPKYFSIPHSSSLDFTTGFSVSAWFNKSTVTSWHTLIGKDVWNLGQGWLIYFDTININYMRAGGPTPTQKAVASYIGSGWHQIIGTNDASVTKIYIDGILVATGTNTIVNSTVSLTIGARHINDGTEGANDPFDGSVDDVRVYNRALSASEVSALYNATR